MPSDRCPPDFRRLYVRDAIQGMVPQSWLLLLADYLHQQGVPPDTLIDPQALAPQPSQHLSRYPAEAWCQLLLRAAERLEDPLLGLHLGQSIQPAHLGALGYVLQASDTLGEAMLRILRYHRLMHDINPIGHQLEGEQLVLEWGVSRGKPGALFDEAGITALVQFARLLLRQGPLALNGLCFVNPAPADTTAFETFFACPVHWGQPTTRLSFPLAWLQTRLQQPDRVLVGLMEPQLDAQLAHLPDTEDLVSLTRRVVKQLAPQGMPELAQVAAELHLSPRVLYRRLAAEGQAFRTLRDSSLRELAEQHLGNPHLSLGMVSERLGYTEQSAFTRAFKRWSGVSPMAWRQQSRSV